MQKIIVGNWKCNPATKNEAIELANKIIKGINNENAEIVICPPYLFLETINNNGIKFELGGQDAFWQEGAYTGEVSASMLGDIGCKYAIIGHSERRKYFGDTDEIVNKKIKAALNAGLIPIFCVGETNEERERGETDEVIKRQITKGLEGIDKTELSKIIIAYEPVWAIGTGNSCESDEAKRVGELIKSIVSRPVLYGGSVNGENFKSYLAGANMDGLLIGGASLKTEEFLKIVNNS